MPEAELKKHGQVSAYEVFMVTLSVYVLLALSIDRVFTLTRHTSEILGIMDSAVCAVFLLDFFIQLGTAPDKLRYLRWGWIDLVSSIPALPVLRWGRMVRIVRLLRILRGLRATKILASTLFAHRAKGALATVLFICLLLVTFGSVTILHVETAPNSNIRTPGDALWWSLTTMATVGYGDKYPVTAEGRAVAIALMIGGIGLFGTFTGYLATWFMEPEARAVGSIAHLTAELCAIRAEIQRLRDEIAAGRADGKLSSVRPDISSEAATTLDADAQHVGIRVGEN